MKKFIWPLSLTLLITGFVLAAKPATAARVFAYPAEMEAAINETFVIDIRLDSEQEIINAVQAQINFPADLLEVVDVDRGNSFLELWVEEPQIDNKTGQVSFVGGIPQGSYVVEGNLLTLTFRVKSAGSAIVSFNGQNTSVHLNDPLGTAAEISFENGLYALGNPMALNIVINSSTHPDEDQWYQNNFVEFDWNTREEAAYSYTLSINPTAEPDETFDTNEGQASFEEVNDGTHYFILKEILPGDDWELVGRRRVKIDKTPPLPITTNFGQHQNIAEGKIFLAFSTTDVGSGVDRYELTEGDDIYTDVTSPYVLADQNRTSDIVIKVIDKAGNIRTTTLPAQNQTTKQALPLWVIIVIAVIAVVAITTYILKKSK
ncbi:cohesin domain-containing protein [Patescibacteria group bacterium]